LSSQNTTLLDAVFHDAVSEQKILRNTEPILI